MREHRQAGLFCLNKVTEENRQAMLDTVSPSGRVVCEMPFSADVSGAGLTGTELTGSYPQVAALARALLG